MHQLGRVERNGMWCTIKVPEEFKIPFRDKRTVQNSALGNKRAVFIALKNKDSGGHILLDTRGRHSKIINSVVSRGKKSHASTDRSFSHCRESLLQERFSEHVLRSINRTRQNVPPLPRKKKKGWSRTRLLHHIL